MTETLELLDKMVLFQRRARLREYLLTQGPKIRAHVLNEGEINPWPYGFSRIIGTKNVEFEDIENPIPGSLQDGESAGRIPVQFIAQFKAVAVGEPAPPPPIAQVARLTEEIPQAELQEQLLEQVS